MAAKNALEIGIVSDFIRQEQVSPNHWSELSKENALDIVSAATRILSTDRIGYVRVSDSGNIEWTTIFQVSQSSCPSSLVQFHANPEQYPHWVAVKIPVDNNESRIITIRVGQRVHIDHEARFIALEQNNWYSNISGPSNGEKPHTEYEFYIPLRK